MSLDRSLADARARGSHDADAVVGMYRSQVEKTLERLREQSPQKAERYERMFEETIAEFRRDNSVDDKPAPEPQFGAESETQPAQQFGGNINV